MNKILTILFIFLSFLGVAQHDTLITFGGYFVTTDGGVSLVGIPSGGGGGFNCGLSRRKGSFRTGHRGRYGRFIKR